MLDDEARNGLLHTREFIKVIWRRLRNMFKKQVNGVM